MWQTGWVAWGPAPRDPCTGPAPHPRRGGLPRLHTLFPGCWQWVVRQWLPKRMSERWPLQTEQQTYPNTGGRVGVQTRSKRSLRADTHNSRRNVQMEAKPAVLAGGWGGEPGLCSSQIHMAKPDP